MGLGFLRLEVNTREFLLCYLIFLSDLFVLSDL